MKHHGPVGSRVKGSERDALPIAYAIWRGSKLGRITDRLEQDAILESIGPPTRLSVLDVGSGDGHLAVALARRGAHVTGVDVSERMVNTARSRSIEAGADVSFVLASAEALPFKSGAFDVVVAVTLLCFVEDVEKTLSEMSRILKPGGQVVVGELGRWSSWAALRRIKGWLGSPIWRRARFWSPRALRQLAREVGLSDCSVTGAIFYPPIEGAARFFGRFDRALGTRTTLGAAFLVLLSAKSDRT